MTGQAHFRILTAITLTLLLVACSGQRLLMPTPNVQVNSGTDAYADLHPNLKNTQVRLFYVTDRVPEQDENGNLEYGYERSPSLAFGSTVVDLDPGPPGRPLKFLGGYFWEVPPGYPAKN